MTDFGPDAANPLSSDSPAVWAELIDAIGPASILVLTDGWISTSLKQTVDAEDIWQEAQLHAWRDRHALEWRGLRSFRNWMLRIVENRIREVADREHAQKRGGGRAAVPFSTLQRSADTGASMAIVTTTPSRLATYREQAAAMQAALAALPEELAEVVRLRRFRQLNIDDVAEALGIGVSAARHRLRKALQFYHRHLASEYASRSLTVSADSATVVPLDSSPKG